MLSFTLPCSCLSAPVAYLIAEANGQDLQMELLKQNGAQKGGTEREVSYQWALSVTGRLQCIDTA